MTPQEIGELIELVISDILTLEEAASIECVSADALRKTIDQVMTFRRASSSFNSVVCLELGSLERRKKCQTYSQTLQPTR